MKSVDTKTRILDVAQDLIQRLGVNGMSYKDISEVVGIRKASIHSHFPKKDDLFISLARTIQRPHSKCFRQYYCFGGVSRS